MLELPQLAKTLGHSIGLLGLLVLIYSQLVQSFSTRRIVFQLAVGALFGAGAIISMLDPIVVAPGVVADLRNVPVLLAGPFGGALAVLVAGAFAAGFRLHEGGIGVLTGVVSILIAAVLALVFTRLVKTEAHRLRAPHLLMLGSASCLSLASIVLLPPAIGLIFLRGVGGPIVLSTIAGVILLGTLLTRELRRMRAEAEVRTLSLIDPLTKLFNRRALDEELDRAFRQAKRRARPLTVLFVDIDHFKRINDELGHEAGDAALVGVANVLRAATRAGDFVARYGGEEFVLLLPSISMEDGIRQAERLRASVENTLIATPAAPISLTVSVGMAALARSMESPEEMLGAADEALLLAKAKGRNWVHMIAADTHQVTKLRTLGNLMRSADDEITRAA